MKFYSPNFEDMSTLPVRYTADSENICPDFEIEDVPEGAESLAILCHDPDATRGVPWIHWLIWDISPKNQSLRGASLPINTISGINSFGFKGYGGPSPSPGTGPHRYVFTLYALSKSPNLVEKATYEEIISELLPITIQSSSWTGLYERK